MRLLVTGGCGFIGSNFLHLLLKEYPNAIVHNVDLLTYAGNIASLGNIPELYKGRYFFHNADIANEREIRNIFYENEFDGVIHFAAESHVDRSIIDPFPFIETNIKGTQNLLFLAKQFDVKKFVHVSTDEVYGSLGDTGVFTELTPLAPNSPYSASKASSDLLCRAWFETYDFPVVITRCSNNYGPYQFPEKLIPLMYLKAKNKEPLPVYGDGLNVRDWIYVEDHCRGVLLTFFEGKPGSVYNFGGNAEKTNLEIVREILKFCNRDESLISFVADRPGHDKRYAMDFSLAKKELGFEPRYTLEEGLLKTLNWYKSNPKWLKDVMTGAYRDFSKKWYEYRAK